MDGHRLFLAPVPVGVSGIDVAVTAGKRKSKIRLIVNEVTLNLK